MRWLWISLAIVLIVFGGGYFLLHMTSPAHEFSLVSDSSSVPMTLKSDAFSHNGFIPPKYTCDGDDISPRLEISDVPEEAVSLALVMHDPDAPREGGWTHWTLWNIDPRTSVIEESSAPAEAIEGTASSGDTGYGGPCPPSGTHHYNFTLYALSVNLDLPNTANKTALEQALEGKSITQTTLTGLYSRD